jgi:hypothetical protein
MTNNEILMLKIFIVQVTAVILGTMSIGAADWLYNTDRIRQSLHSVWVSCSINVICLPVLAWTTNVFLGSGVLSQVLVGALGGAIFFSVYRNLRKLHSAWELGHDLPRGAHGRRPRGRPANPNCKERFDLEITNREIPGEIFPTPSLDEPMRQLIAGSGTHDRGTEVDPVRSGVFPRPYSDAPPADRKAAPVSGET